MRFAVIGVGKIGIYHIRDFINNGCVLKAILNSSIESAKTKSKEIKLKLQFFKLKMNQVLPHQAAQQSSQYLIKLKKNK